MALRKLVNHQQTVQKMLESEHMIGEPAYKYFGVEVVNSELQARKEVL